MKLFEPIGYHKNKNTDPSNPFIKLYGPFPFSHSAVSKNLSSSSLNLFAITRISPPPLLIYMIHRHYTDPWFFVSISRARVYTISKFLKIVWNERLKVAITRILDRVEEKIERVDTIPRFSKILLHKCLKGFTILRFSIVQYKQEKGRCLLLTCDQNRENGYVFQC
ncbi:unnamed protein product [Lactuca saligna]|uniref:Uncharacterized protein n=1 Tax=Lactuca saligna TaxID=75948 RepID=A0AA35YQ22_LACSI|nr:unnamed protein product [Lactuca saligna]